MVLGLIGGHAEDDLKREAENKFKMNEIDFVFVFDYLDKGIKWLRNVVQLLEVLIRVETEFKDTGCGWSHFSAAESAIGVCQAFREENPIARDLGVEVHRDIFRWPTMTGV